MRATTSNMFILLLYCRLVTVLLYLNEPEKGGETAFPLADNETFSTEVWTKINDIGTRETFNRQHKAVCLR